MACTLPVEPLTLLEITDPSQIDASYDVIVAGGGSAGIAAAIATARAGMKTLLHTRASALGGFAGKTIVHSLCGFHIPSPDLIPRQANGGFALEFAERLVKSGAACGPRRTGVFDILLHEPILFTRFCHDLCQREKNLTVLLDAQLDSVEGTESLLETVHFEGREAPVSASVFVDTTREAQTVFLGGADYESAEGRPTRREAFIFCISDQENNATNEDGLVTFSERIVNGIRSGVLTPQIGLAVMKIMILDQDWDACIRLDAEGDHFSALHPDSLIRFQILSGNLALELGNFLRGNVPGFEKCRVSVIPAESFPEESRRVMGRHRLSEEDIQSGMEFDDAVCRLAWPLRADPMLMGEATASPHHPFGGTVPLRSLLSRNIQNLLTAGRCISSSYAAQGSLRVAGTALALGQAAGLAAVRIANSPDLAIPAGAEPEVAATIRTALEQGL